ncbi:unnamed protein product [Closterium sp. NIES-65]|nr:unnamed protein product [Closterium sp. NIES-65]
MLKLWAAALPEETRMDLSGISCLTDAALTRLASLQSLKTINLRGSSGFTAAGMRKLYSLTGLRCLEQGSAATTDAGLEGVTDSGLKYLSNMKSLERLSLKNASITAAGMKWLTGLTSLQKVGTLSSEIKEFIRDTLPWAIATSGHIDA